MTDHLKIGAETVPDEVLAELGTLLSLTKEYPAATQFTYSNHITIGEYKGKVYNWSLLMDTARENFNKLFAGIFRVNECSNGFIGFVSLDSNGEPEQFYTFSDDGLGKDVRPRRTRQRFGDWDNDEVEGED